MKIYPIVVNEAFEKSNGTKGQPPIIVFVHLGQNPAPTLNWYANVLGNSNSSFEIVLITDNPSQHKDFPGRVIFYRRNIDEIGIHRFAKKNKAYAEIAGGYWLYTIERLFVLQILINFYPGIRPVVHLESDNLALFNLEILEWCLTKVKKTSVVRYSETAGIASILISPSIDKLRRDFQSLSVQLEQNIYTQSDMTLLGDALNSEIFDALPSIASAEWELPGKNREFIIFDGAAIGQYLFGLDSIHTGNSHISGYINEHSGLLIQNAQWKLSSRFPVSFSLENNTYYPMNLHIHSKLLLEWPTKESEIWSRYLKEANGLAVRVSIPTKVNSIHSQKISLKNRIRMKIRRTFLTK